MRTLGKHVNGFQNAYRIEIVQMVTIFKGRILSVLAWKTEKKTLYVERNELPQ